MVSQIKPQDALKLIADQETRLADNRRQAELASNNMFIQAIRDLGSEEKARDVFFKPNTFKEAFQMCSEAMMKVGHQDAKDWVRYTPQALREWNLARKIQGVPTLNFPCASDHRSMPPYNWNEAQ